ncbi:MAG TPA: pantoate--beta-alanine ligase [Acidimicrobiales bacterium]|nr:pantoate--beta-alanine ligase [Acidimicrobiales bacterium]
MSEGAGAADPVLTAASELRPLLDRHRAAGRRVGLVGTSGGLHEGHLSLVRRSAGADDVTVLWLFTGRVAMETGVLPSYERDYDRDVAQAVGAGATVVFRPPNETLFALGDPLVRIQVADSLARPWPAADSDVFVGMVATIMAKAINVVGPCRLYCGEKDWQNVVTLRRMVVDLSVPAEIVACPSVREPDGVVLGSRNAKLSVEERRAAPEIKRALDAAAAAIAGGEADPDRIEDLMRRRLGGTGRVEYAVAVDARTLQPVRPLAGDLRLLVSVAFATTNLMDNVAVTGPGSSEEGPA